MFAIKTALYNVDDIWQIPPPIPSTTSPFSYIFPFLYPAATVLSPKVWLYENVSPAYTTFSLSFWQAILKFVVLSVLLASYLVVKVANTSGKASEPIWAVVTFGFVIVNGIVYSSLSSAEIIFLASSTLKSIPSTSGWIVKGSFV